MNTQRYLHLNQHQLARILIVCLVSNRAYEGFSGTAILVTGWSRNSVSCKLKFAKYQFKYTIKKGKVMSATEFFTGRQFFFGKGIRL